ncbi:endonuclease NucS domain-containing protein [Dehalococcoides mccartyi]|uniref:RecB family-like nuclease n=1 Tax=Dehalococcoides mccartyi TaxID=61435 RepID=A0A142V9Q1_9CHLR|nr:endonuclease NucS domain-containing protein [Dehalococcoides mccartyi]AMU85995.1 RecB family-like nuclease [Dehalococcoides mccartyi]
MAVKNYFRIMLGRKSRYADECRKGNFIGVDFEINIDLKGKLPDNWRLFNQEFIPIYLKNHPDKTKVSAGLACGALWTVAKFLNKGDIVLCPNGTGSYLVGEVIEDYSYHPGEVLPHRRAVRWYPNLIERTALSQALQYSTGSIGTVSNITKFADEIEKLISGNTSPTIVSTDDTVEDPSTFALEEHLEEFLIQNWKQTEFGKKYDVYEEDGELVGQQYPSDTGPIDILAISKDKKELLVVELKRGRASDHVVGQVQRYMGYVQQELAEEGQSVKGVIVALEDDIRIRRALSVAPNIEFYRYQVSFKLYKSDMNNAGKKK